jgi:serine/threonine protein phosphatase PrpC
MARLRWGTATDAGQLRTQNEDHLYAGDGLFVVADGMGGHLAGEVASEIAVSRLNERLPADGRNQLDQLVAAVSEANREIYESSLDDPERAGMGTTITAIAVVADPHDGEAFAVANVGDSRIYVMRHGRLRQVTIDHSFVQELVAEGAITRDEARTHPRRNIVTRALGIEPAVRVDSWTMPIIRGDRFVLCSDGLVDEVPDDVIAEVLAAHRDDAQAAADALVAAANAAGGRDNISVVVLDVLEGDDPPDPTEEFDVVPIWNDDGDDTADHPVAASIVADPLDDEQPDAAPAVAAEPALAAAAGATDGDTAVSEAGTAAPPLYDGERDIAELPADGTPPATAEPGPPRKGGRLVRFVLGVGVAAVLIFGAALLTAWARSGYYIAFNDADRVAVYQGQKDTVLWLFNPTEESRGQYTRDELDAASIAFVESEPEFESLESAQRAIAARLTPKDEEPAPTTTAPAPTTTTSIAPATTVAQATPATTVAPGG